MPPSPDCPPFPLKGFLRFVHQPVYLAIGAPEGVEVNLRRFLVEGFLFPL